MSSKNLACRFRDPLGRVELEAIKARRDAADVQALLWEIARLRSLVLRADQLQRSLNEVGLGGAAIVLRALRAELEGEPCVLERGELPGVR
jgi:hypothetical protein